MLFVTDAGTALLKKALAGSAEINFTRIKVGSGGNAGREADSLSHEEMTLPIEQISMSGVVVELEATLNNKDISAEFRATELGVFASDPDDVTKDILYAYEYTESEHADVVPTSEDRKLETRLTIIVYAGGAASVTAKIASGIYSTREELHECVNALRAQINLPYKVVAEAAAMTDPDIGYVYAGTETGYVRGGWYYWDGAAWTLGGTGVDPSLSVAGTPADAQAVGQALITKAPAIYASASGAVASFDDGAGGMPLKSLTVTVLPAQAGTGTPSPDNIRPISGWTGCVLSHSGADTSDPDTLTVTFPAAAGTVYGGTLDLTTGRLSVDRIGRTFAGASDESWSEYGEGANRYFRFFDYRGVPHTSLARGCSHFANVSIASGNTNVGYYVTTGTGSNPHTRLQFRPANIATNYPTVSSWRAWLAEQNADGTPLTCWWRTAAPVAVYSLDPATLRALPGSNRIWADCGTVAVEYPIDTGTALNAKQDALTFDATPTVGSANPVTSGGVAAAVNAKLDIAAFNIHQANRDNPHRVTAAQVGLGSVDNTADLDKPVSAATQTALNALAATVQLVIIHKGDAQDNFTEINAALDAGKTIIVYADDDAKFYALTNIFTQPGTNIFYFTSISANNELTPKIRLDGLRLTRIKQFDFENCAWESFDGALDMNAHNITNLAAPVADGDAANKAYVDAAIAAAIAALEARVAALELGSQKT